LASSSATPSATPGHAAAVPHAFELSTVFLAAAERTLSGIIQLLPRKASA